MADSDINTQKTTVKIVYLMFIADIFIKFLGIVGVIVAFLNKNDVPEWLQSHYEFQIRTFWIGLLILISGVILTFIFIGWFIILFWVGWVTVRCVKGIKYLDQNQAPPNPKTWLF